MKKNIDIQDIKVVGTNAVTSLDCDKIHKRLIEVHKDYSSARQVLETYWDDYYLQYLTTPRASQRVSSSVAKRHVGDVNTSWRHKLKSPKAFETVETIVSWLMQAFFPNEYWFDVKPAIPDYSPDFQAELDFIKFYLGDTLNRAKLKQKFRLFLREMCISGTAALAFPLVGQSLKLEVVPCYNFWLDPSSQDPNNSNFIRHYNVAKPQLLQMIDEEYFNIAEVSDFSDNEFVNAFNTYIQNVVDVNLRALSGTHESPNSERSKYVDCYEYWGNLLIDDVLLVNIRATFTKDVLLGIVPNPFERRPFVVGSYIPLTHSPYGVGAIQPVASQLYFNDILTSRHADNVAVGSDTMLEVVEGQVLDPTKVVIKPGQRIPVTKPGSVVPIVMPTSNLSLQEMGVVQQTIDKATGTGPYIGVNAGRSGERVTAAEISAQREAGGNRLTDIYSDIETTVLLPLLENYYFYLQRFGEAIQAVVISNDDEYLVGDGAVFQKDLRFYVLGANNVADREYRTRQLVDFVNLVSSNQMLAQRVNWDETFKCLAKMFVPDLSDRLYQPAPPPQQMMGGQQQDPLMQELADSAEFSGGQPGLQAAQSMMQAGQLEPAAQEALQRMRLQ